MHGRLRLGSDQLQPRLDEQHLRHLRQPPLDRIHLCGPSHRRSDRLQDGLAHHLRHPLGLAPARTRHLLLPAQRDWDAGPAALEPHALLHLHRFAALLCRRARADREPVRSSWRHGGERDLDRNLFGHRRSGHAALRPDCAHGRRNNRRELVGIDRCQHLQRRSPDRDPGLRRCGRQLRLCRQPDRRLGGVQRVLRRLLHAELRLGLGHALHDAGAGLRLLGCAHEGAQP